MKEDAEVATKAEKFTLAAREKGQVETKEGRKEEGKRRECKKVIKESIKRKTRKKEGK